MDVKTALCLKGAADLAERRIVYGLASPCGPRKAQVCLFKARDDGMLQVSGAFTSLNPLLAEHEIVQI